jgi:hypothetical protein
VVIRRIPARQRLSRIPVKRRCIGADYMLMYMHTIICSSCGGGYRQARMMMYSHCTRSYHLECLTPVLDAIPFKEWFCPTCVEVNNLNQGLGWQNVKTCSDNRALCDYLDSDGNIWLLEEGQTLIFLVTVLWMLVMVAVLWKCDGSTCGPTSALPGNRLYPPIGKQQISVDLYISQDRQP